MPSDDEMRDLHRRAQRKASDALRHRRNRQPKLAAQAHADAADAYLQAAASARALGHEESADSLAWSALSHRQRAAEQSGRAA